MNVRVRYAPSPTGLQHIGGVRTALFNYFFARSQGGKFILRIEDTDQERFNPDSLKDIYDTFGWLGVHWDEGPDIGGPFAPYVQSERTEVYREYAEKLVVSGHAYRCYCTPERLHSLRREQQGKNLPQGYDRRCRNLTEAEQTEFRSQGIEPVIRFKVPLSGSTVLEDIILGRIERKNEDVSTDPVLLKSDGFPTYHLANVIDDHFMEITHILRAQEWIPSGPLHVLLYQAFGWTPPAYCHLPLVTGTDGAKLSKRHGATSIIEFRNAGYLPDALINYISLLGWAYDDSRELFSVKDLERLFSLEKLNKSPAVFDYKKLEWFNGIYIRDRLDADLVGDLTPFMQRSGLVSDPPVEKELELLRAALPLIRERLHFLGDAPEMVAFLYREIESYNAEEAVPKKMDAKSTVAVLDALLPVLEGFADWSDEEVEERLRGLAEQLGQKLGNVMMPLRVAVTGSRVSPPLIGSIRLLGIEKTVKRVKKLKELLESKT
ncbi:MAG TPA: glutamate--tRNA ligase [Spirochaetia bacterium]|nr:glutamate--tRNA ligase [Spirochaetia bacterium]